MEDAFIDLAFTSVKIEGITKQEIKNYIRYIANKRMIQLGYYYIYPDNLNNPLKWIEPILNGVEFTNFFEGRVTAYAKGASKGSWDDAWN